MLEGQADLRIGYLVTAYKEQSQLQRLLRTLLKSDPTCEIALHFDRSDSSLDLGVLADERLHVLPEWEGVTWGDASYLRVLLRGLRWWSQRDVDWVIVLSGQDYPIRPAAELREFLANSGKNSFIWGGRVNVPPSQYRSGDLDASQRRYFVHWAKVPRVLWGPLTKPITRQGLRVAQHVLPGGQLIRDLPPNDRPWLGWRPFGAPPFNNDWPCWSGWDNFGVDQRAISILTGDEPRVRKLRRWYKRTMVPTESFFITVLRGHSSIRSGALALHYAHWDKVCEPHPVVLDERAFNVMRDSERFFARIFDSGSTAVLDRIDAELLTRDPSRPSRRRALGESTHIQARKIAHEAILTHKALQKGGELAQFLTLLMEIKPKLIVEIGSDEGGTLWAWQQLGCRVIGVTLADGPFGSAPRVKVNSHGCEMVYGDSHDAATVERLQDVVAGDRVDVLFIDGDHTLQGVKSDFECFSSLVRPGGVVAFHDICDHPHHPTVQVKAFWDTLDWNGQREEIVADPVDWGGIGVLRVPASGG